MNFLCFIKFFQVASGLRGGFFNFGRIMKMALFENLLEKILKFF